ncbi:MAG: hypothetical protein ACTSRN_01130 [Alphaproteobacteria bacterium]
MIFFVLTVVAGLIGGVFVSQFSKEHSLGTLGNVITGLTGGLAANVLIEYLTAGNEFSVAIVGGFLGGVLVRVGFSIIRQRTKK